MHIQRHTHTSTHVQSAHKRNSDNQAQEPGWEGRKKIFVRDLAHTHTQKKNRKKTHQRKLIFTNLKKEFEHIVLPAKLLDYFLRSNKCNINQSFPRSHWIDQTWKRRQKISESYIKVGLGISRTNADSQWNPVYNAFHRYFCCWNETRQ